LYRLREASGRERKTTIPNPDSHAGIPQSQLATASDSELRKYDQYYTYDAVGNIKEVKHIAPGGGWTRGYVYEAENNRLVRETIGGGITNAYTHDLHGSMKAMGHLNALDWDFKDQLIHTEINVNQDLYCTYDSGRQRVRKIYKTADNIKERIYLGGYEIYRLRSANGNTFNQQIDTLHIMDDQQRICLIETEEAKQALVRYQLNNHLGSACIELSADAEVISYEEYYPYGSSSYRAQKGRLEGNLKRYRYSGKELDESTGLYYYGARYYAGWLGRWCSADPAGLVDGGNLFGFVLDSPISFFDIGGYSAMPSDEQIIYQEILEAEASDDLSFRLPSFIKRVTPEGIKEVEDRLNKSVLGALPDGSGYAGPLRDYKRAVEVQNNQRAIGILNNIAGGVGGAVGYIFNGERGAKAGAMIDSITQSLYGHFQRKQSPKNNPGNTPIHLIYPRSNYPKKDKTGRFHGKDGRFVSPPNKGKSNRAGGRKSTIKGNKGDYPKKDKTGRFHGKDGRFVSPPDKGGSNKDREHGSPLRGYERRPVTPLGE